MAVDRLQAAAMSLRVVADTTGLEADLASKLTRAERVATESAARTSAAVGKIANSTGQIGVKAEAATLRASAAQETYNRLLRAGEQDTVRLARAQATALTAQATAQREQSRILAGSALSTGGATEAGLLGGSRNLIGLAAGAGLFTAVRQGVTAFNELGGSIRAYQRATGDTAESSSKMVEIMARFGIEGEAATQSVLRLGRNIEQTPEKLTKYGVAIARSKDGTVDLTNTILNANDAFHKTPDAATRASLVLDLFGRGGQKLLPILSANRQQLEEFVDAARKSGRIFTQDQLTQAFEFQQASHDIKDAWAGFTIVLAKGVVPALKDMSQIGTHVLDFFGSHSELTSIVTRLGETGLALYGINKAIKTFDAVKGSTLFTKILNVGSTQAATAANLELAASYTAIGAAAASAVPSVVALDGAEAAGGGLAAAGGLAGAGSVIGAAGAGAIGGTSLARIGTLGRTGALLRGATLAAGVIDPVILASVFAGQDNGPKGFDSASEANTKLLQNFSYKDGQYFSGGKTVTDPRVLAILSVNDVRGRPLKTDTGPQVRKLATTYPGLFSNPYGNGQDSVPAFVAQNKLLAGSMGDDAAATQISAQSRAAMQQAAQSYAGSLDIFSGAPRVGPDPDALAAAKADAVTARNRVGLDAQALAALRAGHPGSQASILSAEQALAKARDHGSPLQVQAAEAKLTQLRNGGKATALQLAKAEETLRIAKEKSAEATKKVHDVEKGGLQTAKEVLASLNSQKAYTQRNAAAVDRLVAEGASPDEIARLVAQDKTTPGELQNFAKTATPKLVRNIRESLKGLNASALTIQAATGTDADWRAAAVAHAKAYMDTIRENTFLTTPNGGIKSTRASRAASRSTRVRNLGGGVQATLGI